jgi:flagellar hook-associated protein 1 FlgK
MVQPLVLGTTASTITTVQDPLDPTRLQLALQTAGGTVDILAQCFGRLAGRPARLAPRNAGSRAQ